MPPLRVEHLHRFFKAVSESVSHAVLLGGTVEISALNQWVIIGLHLRQSVTLYGNTLIVQNPHEDVEPKQAPTPPVTQTITPGDPALFTILEQARHQARHWPDEQEAYRLPMGGGLIGALGYTFYPWCDPHWYATKDAPLTKAPEPDTTASPQRIQDHSTLNPETISPIRSSVAPDLLFYEFEDWLFLSLETSQLTILSPSEERKAAYSKQWDTQTACSRESVTPLNPKADDRAARSTAFDTAIMAEYLNLFQASLSPQAFEAAVSALQYKIQTGELYQANLSLRLQKEVEGDPYRLFEQLCTKNPSPFSAFLKWPEGIIVSNSPERLVHSDAMEHVQTRPIAGTRGRGRDAQEDQAIGDSLLQNEKERAEHLMLVDLARNDLGRVCQSGSVQVDAELVLERYSHVTHLVSNVSGVLKPDTSPWVLLQSLFPGGTITGCPKIRCIDSLAALEPVSRGFYTGSLGYIDARSNAMDWNILIRSVFLQPQTKPFRYNASIHVGAGIVHDAVPAHEYRECLRKATASLQALWELERQQNPTPDSHTPPSSISAH